MINIYNDDKKMFSIDTELFKNILELASKMAHVKSLDYQDFGDRVKSKLYFDTYITADNMLSDLKRSL